MFHKVQAVKPLKNFTLLVTFIDREQRQYDLKPLFKKWDTFLPLIQFPGLFEQVQVDTGGYGISWNDDIDLSCDELYYNGFDCSMQSDPKYTESISNKPKDPLGV